MITETVVRLRPMMRTDPYSDELVADWSQAPEEAEYSGCLIAARTSSEPDEVGRTATIIGHTVYLPHPADVTSQDRLRYRGRVHNVEGEPFDWGPGIEADTQLVEG